MKHRSGDALICSGGHFDKETRSQQMGAEPHTSPRLRKTSIRTRSSVWDMKSLRSLHAVEGQVTRHSVQGLWKSRGTEDKSVQLCRIGGGEDRKAGRGKE